MLCNNMYKLWCISIYLFLVMLHITVYGMVVALYSSCQIIRLYRGNQESMALSLVCRYVPYTNIQGFLQN